jgi:hypothetical protein
MGGFVMHTLHGNCTGSCAAESPYLKDFRGIAHITHIFLRNNIIEHLVRVCRCHTSPKHHTKVSCENAVQCVQIAEYVATKGIQLHSYMCASLCNLCIFGVNPHE